MINAKDHDFMLGLVDSVQHSVGASACRTDAGEVAAEPLADAMWVLDERSGDELDDRRCYGLGKGGLDGSNGWWGEDQFVSSLTHEASRERH